MHIILLVALLSCVLLYLLVVIKLGAVYFTSTEPFKHLVVVSINVFQSVDTLEYQIETIKKHIHSKYVVILNCNRYMYDKLTNMTLDDNVYVNPEIIEKQRFHGSLMKGIVSNMKYALLHFEFSYFVMLSARTIFYRDIDIATFDKYFAKNKWVSVDEMEQKRRNTAPYVGWHWETLKNTKLAQYYTDKTYKLTSGAHEGLCFSYNVSRTIIKFLEDNAEIAEDLYTFHGCVEEFAMQTIASNEYNRTHFEYGFVDIGNGVGEEYDPHDVNKYTRKIMFLADP